MCCAGHFLLGDDAEGSTESAVLESHICRRAVERHRTYLPVTSRPVEVKFAPAPARRRTAMRHKKT